MSKQIDAIRGMNDILPEQTRVWQFVESRLTQIVASYGYSEIRFPIVESTHLFKRSIGEVTDIVEKEMYTFPDRNDESLTLRPEGTAVCVRAGIQRGLLYNQQQRLWYCGPMFRYEKPQKGRYRQFHQFGVETFGFEGPDIDVELILMAARMWQALGIQDWVELQINSLGSTDDRQAYRAQLIEYFEQHQQQLDEDSQRRLYSNPLRILDSKNPAMQDLIEAAPKLMGALCEASKNHFEQLCQQLDQLGIRYNVNPRLVRGLDYYNLTVFEWVTDKLGAQGTVCAGGRYDSLVEQLGGKATPAFGFAMGLERLIELVMLTEPEAQLAPTTDIYVVTAGAQGQLFGVQTAEQLRQQFPSLRIMQHCGGGNFKKQMKRADKTDAKIALIIGDDEASNQQVSIKFLREQKPQLTVTIAELSQFISTEFNQ